MPMGLRRSISSKRSRSSSSLRKARKRLRPSSLLLRYASSRLLYLQQPSRCPCSIKHLHRLLDDVYESWAAREPHVRGSAILGFIEQVGLSGPPRQPHSKLFNLLHWHVQLRHRMASTILCQLPVYHQTDSSNSLRDLSCHMAGRGARPEISSLMVFRRPHAGSSAAAPWYAQSTASQQSKLT